MPRAFSSACHREGELDRHGLPGARVRLPFSTSNRAGPTMSTTRSIQRAASTYLVHFFDSGPQEEGHYVVARFETAASDEIRPHSANKEGVGQRKRRATMSCRAGRRLRLVSSEIIIATNVNRDADMQLFGASEAGIALHGKRRC